MSKNIVEINKELSKLMLELERVPSAEVRLLVGLGFDGCPRYAPVSDVRDVLNEAWKHLNEANNLLADMEAV